MKQEQLLKRVKKLQLEIVLHEKRIREKKSEIEELMKQDGDFDE